MDWKNKHRYQISQRTGVKQTSTKTSACYTYFPFYFFFFVIYFCPLFFFSQLTRSIIWKDPLAFRRSMNFQSIWEVREPRDFSTETTPNKYFKKVQKKRVRNFFIFAICNETLIVQLHKVPSAQCLYKDTSYVISEGI